ncbi:unnamed protein product [Adineta ricciae]|uniref:Uncharacterized protein n=1 Tax=Adineta ricciae TaxID=249248 RepID=A0A815P2S3_ADIRI|nr:unnamed protein product [Adineta ricciae]CAF1551547.1 unnamed protein product [Adineta ricciae]
MEINCTKLRKSFFLILKSENSDFKRKLSDIQLFHLETLLITLTHPQEERVHIEITFLANGYSLAFVQDQLKQFLIRFNPSSGEQPMDLNRGTYTSFRIQLFRHFRQQKVHLEERQELENKHQLVELYYLYDWGSRHEFNQYFYQHWTRTINKDPRFLKHGLKIILNSKHCFLSNTLLVQYKAN